MITQPDAFLTSPTNEAEQKELDTLLIFVKGWEPSVPLDVTVTVDFVDNHQDVVGTGTIKGRVAGTITVDDGLSLIVLATGERIALTTL